MIKVLPEVIFRNPGNAVAVTFLDLVLGKTWLSKRGGGKREGGLVFSLSTYLCNTLAGIVRCFQPVMGKGGGRVRFVD